MPSTTPTAQSLMKLEIDGRSFEASEGTTLDELFVKSFREGFKQGIAAKLNGKVVDFHTPIRESGRVELIPLDSPEGLRVLRHSTAHLMASAVLKLFPNAKLAIGPAIDEGFYYDFQVDRPFQPEDLAQIEEWMKKIAEEDHPFVRAEMSRSEAMLQYKDKNEPFKVELLERIPDETVSTYTHSFFT